MTSASKKRKPSLRARVLAAFLLVIVVGATLHAALLQQQLLLLLRGAGLDAALYAELERRFVLVSAGALLIGTAAFLGIAVFLSWLIARPIRALTDAVAAVAGGNLETRVSVNTRDEFSELAEYFNLMIASLEKARTELELKVDRRTAELVRTNERLLAEVIDRRGAEQRLEEKNRELEQAYTALRASKEELQRLFERVQQAKREWELSMDSSGDCIILVDAAERIKRCNKTFKDLVKLPYDQVLGRDGKELLAELGLINDRLKGYDQARELSHAATGRTFMLNSYEYRDGKLGSSGMVLTLHDVTELKKIGAALERKHLELEKAYRDLKDAQSKVLQQDKMASIGQLSAGIAHEINNPMGFIISNLNTLRKHVARLSQFLAAQSEALEELSRGGVPDASAVLARVEGLRSSLKVDQIASDLDGVITESLDGADRVRRIVQDLKSFSRVDEVEEQPADVNACLESTLNILRNELKYKALVRKDYGRLPPTLCNPRRLNQVFMNLLVNAVHAIDERGEITIRTWSEDGSIYAAVSDTGRGIPREHLGRVFEPFFTTKEIGKGTGLGLSIVYDIVKKHDGDIAVSSEAGKGATFTVRIPVKGATGRNEG